MRFSHPDEGSSTRPGDSSVFLLRELRDIGPLQRWHSSEVFTLSSFLFEELQFFRFHDRYENLIRTFWAKVLVNSKCT